MRKFNNSFPGYNKNEVNSFVKNVTTEYESMLNNLKTRDQEIETLKKELEHYKSIESTLNRAILIAEESSQNIKKTAFDESKVIIEDAKRNASRIINNALIKAEKVEMEANNLKRQVAQYKRRYKNILEEQLDQIERLDLDN
ncbi:MAG: DivIVA domain-containing protein [Bacilli bacterium]|nr:DivIVA domain-containing protein [Bacilli bacterium]MBQ8901902.1 DivIVA domain-containing protein [Bacilli bacterium]